MVSHVEDGTDYDAEQIRFFGVTTLVFLEVNTVKFELELLRQIRFPSAVGSGFTQAVVSEFSDRFVEFGKVMGLLLRAYLDTC